jgi:peptide deformylase
MVSDYNESRLANRDQGVRLVSQIVQYPHPALRYRSRPVTQIDDDLRATVEQMFRLMYEARGVGLAANQVGLPFRFFVLNLTADPEQKHEERVFINPQIVKRHSSVEDEEGCLSLPGLYTKIRRARKVRVQAFDLQGNPVEYEAEDLFARAVQHETDHVEGKLFIDYLGPLARHAIKDKLQEFEQQYREAQASGAIAPEAELVQQLDAMPRPSPAVFNPAGLSLS